jgi:hypothetical protein
MSDCTFPCVTNVIAAVAVAVAVVSLALTLQLQRRTAELSRKPVLVFVYTENGWDLRNVGYGPALNVVMSRRPIEPESGQWTEHIRIPPLSKDATFPISWARHVSKQLWRATYEDIAGGSYTSECVRDLTKIYDKFLPPRWKEQDIQRAWQKE